MISTEQPTNFLLTEKQVCERIAIGRVTLWKLCRDGSFPQPLRVGLRSKRWRSTEIDQWINNLSQESC